MNKALGGMGFGITCLTPENRQAPWILFEAGALSKTFDDDKSRLWTYLLAGLKPQDVEPPLSQFQHTKAEREDTLKLVQSLNSSINTPEDRLHDDVVKDSFNAFWPMLEKAISAVPAPEKPTNPKRSSEEMLAEVLELCRQYLPSLSDSVEAQALRAIPSTTFTFDPNVGFNRLATLAELRPQKYSYVVRTRSDKDPKRIIGDVEIRSGDKLQIFDSGKRVAEFDNVTSFTKVIIPGS
jgi:hypothetical protein